MDYDVLILGGGLIGCAVAYELSKYNLNISLIEKDYDIADDVAFMNTSIVYDGIGDEDSLTSKLQRMGNSLMDELTEKFNVPFKRCGSLMISEKPECTYLLDEVYQNSLKNKIKDMELLDENKVKLMEPSLNRSIHKALYSERTGVICPYDLALAYGEVAFDNNVNFKLEEEVLDIKKEAKGFKVYTNKNKFTCKIVINTTHGKKYSIDSENYKGYYDNKKSKLKYFSLNKDFKQDFSNIVFSMGEDGTIYTVPTLNGETLGGVITNDEMNNSMVLEKLYNLLPDINPNLINTFYESEYNIEPVIIDDSFIDIGYIKIVGKHFALVTMAPAIANIVCETVVGNINCKLKKDFVDKRRDYYTFRDMTNEERQRIIELDNRYGNVICACERVTEGEIIDAIRRPLGARTVEGVKRRTGAAFGRCQGAQCINKIVSILARETNRQITEIVKDSKNSKILLNRIKEFDII